MTRRILCISLSPIHRDARVLRQIDVLRRLGEVTTIGYGPMPAGVHEHIEIPENLMSLPQTLRGVAKLAMRRFAAVELDAPGVRFGIDVLADQRFDLVVANDARVLGMAFRLAHGAPVWADMHEWAPEERTHILAWRLLVAPFMVHLCRTYLPQAACVTTVGDEIADLYRRDFGVRPAVMRNAAAFADLEPSAVEPDRIRLVHSGGAVHGRDLELMIDTVRQLDDRFSLDLYLVPGTPGYLESLRDRASGDTRIVFHDPVPPSDLPEVLNSYDVGVFWIPPVHTNARLTLPNKLFDYVQARLAVAIGPTIEMQRLVDEFGIGVVSDGFSVNAAARSLQMLEPSALEEYKRKAHRAAHVLSFEHERAAALKMLGDVLSGSV